ncbi:MAG: RecQ family ATP-dependent DNA helicase [Schleiferiaceae bacterium]
MSSAGPDLLQAILQRIWGYPDFRPLQRPIAESVLSGRDTVALLPTGGGKSLCFQVPGLALGGTTVVISPLISLMADQVAQLVRRGVDARSLAGDLKPQDWADLQRRPPTFAYVSPERARSRNFIRLLEFWDVRLLAIDEAHCVSQWGHDFRPQYTQLRELRELLPNVPCLALTASATPLVLRDLVALLGLQDPQLFQASFARPNLIWTVHETPDIESECASRLRPMDGRQIVYVRSRAGAARWAEVLRRHGIPAAAYHAGMAREDRAHLQEDWGSGRIRTMVATTAFGMGIDQPDVRQVVHVELPESPESLYQEIGRGGRDGGDAEAIMFADPKAISRFLRKMERSIPPFADWTRSYHALASRAQIAVGDGVGVRLNPRTPDEERVLATLARKGLAELLSEAPATLRLQLRYGGSQLVDTAEANPRFTELLYALARRYPGIVHRAERVEAAVLSSYLGWTQAEVLQRIHEAAAVQVVVLEGAAAPGSSSRWTHPRYPDGRSPIPRSEWDRDQERILGRARAVAGMMDPQASVCRFAQLLRYFGETASDCGRCDVCQSRTSPPEAAQNVLRALEQSEQGRLSVRDAAAASQLGRADAASLLGRGAELGWWTLGEDGWLGR